MRRPRLIERRQRAVAQVDQLELGVAAAGRHVVDQRGDLLTVTVGAGAAQDDADPDHRDSPALVVTRIRTAAPG